MTNPFEQLCLDPAIVRAVADEGYLEPTEIQTAAIPIILGGHDLIGTAQTGTGKTAAFSLPILDLLHRKTARHPGSVRALILTPTRELALQIDLSMRTYGRHLKFDTAVILGGVSLHSQIQALRKKPAIVVATPGRLLDLMQQKHVSLSNVEILVLDEADRMLDMGFIHDVQRIVDRTPAARQTLLFSATMSSDVTRLAHDIMRDPQRVATTPPATISDNIQQQVMFVDQINKGSLLADVLQGKDVRRALVFTRTKHRADRIIRQLTQKGISADAIHSNKSQNARQRALAAFDRGRITVLVATDIVARGIDVEGISHVINYELPNDPSNYVHRIGRTARAGAIGKALSFCDASEVMMLKGIETLTKQALTTVEDHPFHSEMVASLHKPRKDAAAQWRSFGPKGRFGRRSTALN